MRGIHVCLNKQKCLRYLLAVWTTLCITVMYYGVCNDSYRRDAVLGSGINKHEAQLQM